MTHDSQPLKRLQELEDQLSVLQQERDQLKQQIEADKIQAIQNVQPLLEKINNSIKLHGLSVVISDNLGIYLTHQRDLDNKFILCYVEHDELEKALNIVEQHTKFITTVISVFSLYENVSAFSIDLSKQLLTFSILSDSYSVKFVYDTASETVSAYAHASRNRMHMSFMFDNVTMSVEADNHAVHYSLKTQTYTENLDQFPTLYNQVKIDMLSVLSKLSI